MFHQSPEAVVQMKEDHSGGATLFRTVGAVYRANGVRGSR